MGSGEVVLACGQSPVQRGLGGRAEPAVHRTGVEAAFTEVALNDADGVDGNVHGGSSGSRGDVPRCSPPGRRYQPEVEAGLDTVRGWDGPVLGRWG